MQFALAVKDAVGRLVPAELRGVDAETGHLPHQVVATRGPMQVLYFAPREGVARHKTPIVFAYSLINRWYILDFMPGRSLLEHLTGAGHPCYVIDWGVPGLAERHKTWGDYAIRLVDFAMRTACEREGVAQAHLYGYCMGGTLALCYAALRPARVKSFVAMATPVDFHDEGLLSLWTRPAFFDAGKLVDAFGNVPTWLMESGFRFLNPVANSSKWRSLWENRNEPGFAETWRRMEKWSSDNVPFPGEVYRQYIRDTYQQNAFFKGTMVVDGEVVNHGHYTGPLLLVLASKDHIVPRASALALQGITGSQDVSVLEFPAGHIGLSTSSKGPSTYWPRIDAWLAAKGD